MDMWWCPEGSSIIGKVYLVQKCECVPAGVGLHGNVGEDGGEEGAGDDGDV